MNNIIGIQIPKGIMYLGNYPELINQLPNQSFIFNKVMTGCGATTMYLKDSVPTILCSPRREMIHCKANSKEFKGHVHLFGSEHPTGKVLQKINDMKTYIRSTIPSPFETQVVTRIPKILVTYDSASYVLQGLQELHLLGNFRVVVDEFQTLFTDAAFRGDTEVEFMENISTVGLPTVYLSATPYLKEYLNQLPEFATLPYVELIWPESSKHRTNIVPTRYIGGSKSSTIDNIIRTYRQRGYFEEIMDLEGNIYRAYEAVFFINDPRFITQTVIRNNLSPNEVNVICAECNKNEKTLAKAGLTIGHAPQEGMPHKTFTFATKCAYEGTDFYSTNAFTYIFSEIKPNYNNLGIDISLDLPQIMGRQRCAQNPFRYSARMYCKNIPTFDEASEQAFYQKINDKEAETIDAVSDFDKITDPRKRQRDARKYRNSQKVEKYVNDYISVVDDKQIGQPKLVFNQYVMLNEVRAWQVQCDQYRNGTYVMNTVNQAFGNSTNAVSIAVNNFLSTFSGTFERRMRMYAEYVDSHPEYRGELQMCIQVPTYMKDYYNALGTESLRALSWKEVNIKAALSQSVVRESTDIGNTIRQTFRAGWYSLGDIKMTLQGIYNEYGMGTAKATDIEKYCQCQRAKTTGSDGMRINGYKIL